MDIFVYKTFLILFCTIYCVDIAFAPNILFNVSKYSILYFLCFSKFFNCNFFSTAKKESPFNLYKGSNSDCRSFTATEYKYEKFFNVESTTKCLVCMRFDVKGNREAYVFFSQSKNTETGYEIGGFYKLIDNP